MKDNQMQRPGWENKWNPNTMLAAANLLMLVAGGGFLYAKTLAIAEKNSEAIIRIENVQAVQSQNMSTFANVPYRITALESRVGTIERDARGSENSITELRTDIKYIREVLERLDPQRRR